jgi:hypothetical protein
MQYVFAVPYLFRRSGNILLPLQEERSKNNENDNIW